MDQDDKKNVDSEIAKEDLNQSTPDMSIREGGAKFLAELRAMPYDFSKAGKTVIICHGMPLQEPDVPREEIKNSVQEDINKKEDPEGQKQMSFREQKEAILNKYPELKAITENITDQMEGQTSIIIFPKRSTTTDKKTIQKEKKEVPQVTTKTKEEILAAPKESLTGDEQDLQYLLDLYPEWTLEQAIRNLDLIY